MSESGDVAQRAPSIQRGTSVCPTSRIDLLNRVLCHENPGANLVEQAERSPHEHGWCASNKTVFEIGELSFKTLKGNWTTNSSTDRRMYVRRIQKVEFQSFRGRLVTPLCSEAPLRYNSSTVYCYEHIDLFAKEIAEESC